MACALIGQSGHRGHTCPSCANRHNLAKDDENKSFVPTAECIECYHSTNHRVGKCNFKKRDGIN